MHTLGIPLGMQIYRRTARDQPFEKSTKCGELGRDPPKPVGPPGILPNID